MYFSTVFQQKIIQLCNKWSSILQEPRQDLRQESWVIYEKLQKKYDFNVVEEPLRLYLKALVNHFKYLKKCMRTLEDGEPVNDLRLEVESFDYVIQISRDYSEEYLAKLYTRSLISMLEEISKDCLEAEVLRAVYDPEFWALATKRIMEVGGSNQVDLKDFSGFLGISESKVYRIIKNLRLVKREVDYYESEAI